MSPIVRPAFRKEQQLMPNRVREVLLLSSQYDAFVLEEDGQLTEQVFMEYKSLSLSSAPNFTHATTPEAALDLLRRRRFDLVLTITREATLDLVEFGKKVKALRFDQPVVALGFESADRQLLRAMVSPEAFDAVFLWTGDAKILLAIIKRIEDFINVDNDIEVADVRVILVVEDSIRYYSAFLAALYPELMKQSQSLFSEGLNRLQKLLKMRTRPKILHALNYEQAMELYEKYRNNILAVISDVGFPVEGKLDPEAGLKLVRRIRVDNPDMAILLQSAQEDFSKKADELSIQFINKNSPELFYTVRRFLTDHLGFGSFIFRLPDGREVARAADLRELAECIRTVPDESLEYHARRNHISVWLIARSEFELAELLRPQKVDDFESIDDVREFLSESLEATFRQARRGVITDFSDVEFDVHSVFQRIGEGSLGGKARGIAFLNFLLREMSSLGQVAGLDLRIPQTFVLTTDAFDRFLRENQLFHVIAAEPPDGEIMQYFQSAQLPEEVEYNLRTILEHVEGPLAIRSSSMLEDDMLHPFAGIYGTVMIPNLASNLEDRLQDLCQAIKTVYATTFFQNARVYLENTGRSLEEEQMAVCIQRMVGQRHGHRFYPHFSGVAHSYNYYPIGSLKASDGVVQAVLGLGRMVVDGGEAVRFCPRHPGVIPQFATPALVMENSQRRFYALDLEKDWNEPETTFTGNQVLYGLAKSREDGTFNAVGSVFDNQNNVIVERSDLDGPLVITFNNILKHKAIALAPAMEELLDMITTGMGTPVELEFACDMGDWGRAIGRSQKRRPPELHLLQVRPILIREALQEIHAEEFDPATVICKSTQALGHGLYSGLHDVVYVKHETFDPAKTSTIAAEVGRFNRKLIEQKRPYVLIGPGRWGSSDHWLGIPVQWSQIAGARIIIEASPAGYNVEPSQGTHFFHNITALRLGYFTIPPGSSKVDQSDGGFVDWEWLTGLPAIEETGFLRHVRSQAPLVAHIDGRQGLGLIAWREGEDRF
jgi:DNA-binding NarL/FixJ family response regulator